MLSNGIVPVSPRSSEDDTLSSGLEFSYPPGPSSSTTPLLSTRQRLSAFDSDLFVPTARRTMTVTSFIHKLEVEHEPGLSNTELFLNVS